MGTPKQSLTTGSRREHLLSLKDKEGGLDPLRCFDDRTFEKAQLQIQETPKG